MNKVVILGSTGSIGKITLKIIRPNIKNFNVILLSTHSNVKEIFQQAVEFKVKNVIIINNYKRELWKRKFYQKKIKVYSNYDNFNKIFPKRVDYTINAISGIDGLEPTIKIIKFTKKIAIANKESIICGWNLIKKQLLKYKTNFIPVDSEHFSIFRLLNNQKKKILNKIIITASGGPFLKKKIKKIKIKDALKHPNWKMGKKITIDSSTLMNKVFEVIEAKKIFDISFNKIKILINPNSYIHTILIFNNGTIEILAHENNMDIPIYNSIYENDKNSIYSPNKLNLKKINNLDLTNPDYKKFKSLNLLKLIPEKDSLFETILITVNDELVHMFLNKKIEYKQILFYLIKIINFKILRKYCKVKPNSIKQIINARNFAKKIVYKNVKLQN